ncbi:hypothetical protein JS528_11235 [Bifidobacterium sp. MA2]|uniref:Uncharacterized protein n=1 Tax=Bifidobacterium santillanense TaxID=2809028 RepID=A0ABS5USG8_9BIFI|nr:hypothetical protein [Bifidobacterium santillanense]MBT1173892.1 hypothetical protein [Bifidobacterium santillanense]
MKKTYCDMCGNELSGKGLHMDIDLFSRSDSDMKSYHMDFDVCDDCAEDYEGDTLGYLGIGQDRTLSFEKES